MLSPHEYARLPGPTQAIQDITDDLYAGLSVVVVFPDHMVEAQTADAVLDEIHTAGGSAYFCDSIDTEPFPARVLSTFGANTTTHREYDNWETVINWEPWHGSWVFVTSWDHSDVRTIIDRWPPQLHASALSISDRPKLVIGVRLSDVERGTLARLDKGSIAVYWWWGVLDRLDTETRLAAVAGRTLNSVDAAVITEVSGWDLHCVDYLTEHWDRTTAGLPRVIRGYQALRPAIDIDNISSALRSTSTPPPDREEAWQAGLVDRWGHTVRRSPRVLDDKDITQRLWIAHNRTLIPLVDEERGHYEQLILQAARPHALADLDRRDDDIIEIGSLAWLALTGRVAITRDQTDRLCAFRDLRNDLAHRVPINDELLKRAVSYLGL